MNAEAAALILFLLGLGVCVVALCAAGYVTLDGTRSPAPAHPPEYYDRILEEHRKAVGPAPFKRGEWVRFKDDETGDTSLKFEVFNVFFDDFSWRITTRYGYGQPSMWFVKCDPPQQA